MDLISVYGAVAVVMTLVLLYRVKKITGNLVFNPLSMSIMTFTVSFMTVITVYSSGDIPISGFYVILMFFSIFFVSIFFLQSLIRKTYFINERNSRIRKIDEQFLYVLFAVSLMVSLLYVYLLWSSYNSGDERLLLNKQYRALSLFKILLDFWVVVLASIIYAQSKQKYTQIILLLTIVFAFFSGAKGAALGMFLWVLMFYFIFNRINVKKLLLVCILFVVTLFIPTWWMYGPGFIEKISYRISMSGDLYLLAFVLGDYSQLQGFYDPIRYLLHPFTSLIGIRGYGYPLGAELIGTAGHVVTGTGPNPHLPLLALTFWPDCFFCVVLFAFSTVFVFILTVYLAFRSYNHFRLPLFFRVFLFSMLLSAAFDLFVDIGAYEFKIILCLLGFAIYLLFTFLKQLSQLKTHV
ncbi:MAG: hypothetical protein IE909_12960 [Campylobacterales bacterium]|nr:hypothetical protein [Campylobacterales bacterium]